METQKASAASSPSARHKLTTRRKLLLYGLASGKPMREAAKGARMAREAGYHALEEMRQIVPELMREIGLDERSVLLKVRDLAEATKTITASSNGEITDSIEVADNQARCKGVELAANLLGLLQREERADIGTINIYWSGGAPAWAKRLPQGDSNDVVSERLPDGDSNSSVTGELTPPPPISAIEGTGIGPPGPSPTDSGNSGDPSVLTQRVAKKRKPRLPVYKGRK